MPFLIPLIPVLTGAITGLAAELAIGAAVMGGLGYVAKDQDLMRVGGLLGIASLGFGIAGASETAAAQASTDFGVDPGVMEASGVTGEVAAEGAAQASTEFGVDPGEIVAGGSGTGSIETAEALNQAGQSSLAGESSMEFGVDPYNDVPELPGSASDELAQATKDAAGESDKFGLDPESRSKMPTWEEFYKAKSADPADTLMSKAMEKWNSLGDKEKAAWLQLGGSALSGLTPDQRAEAYKKQLEFEMMKYRERLKNMNNVGFINLSMNPNQAPKPY